jgi:hypothetical protein
MADEYYKRTRAVRKLIDEVEFEQLCNKAMLYCSENDMVGIKYELPEKHLIDWQWLFDGYSVSREHYLILAYRHLGFGDATAPITIIRKLFNHFFPEKAKTITRWERKDSSKPNTADQINLSLQTAISDFHAATDQFLQQNTCPQKTDAGNAPFATKNM